MRLIDADNYTGKVIASRTCCGVNKLLEMDSVPTAYDVDAVVEQLEKEKKRAFELCLAINDKAQRQQYIIEEQTMALAIEIVKGGGLDV